MEEKNNKTIEFGNLYDINKNIVKQNEIKLSEGLLNRCNERKDYTVFDFKEKKWAERCLDCAKCLVDECLTNRGEIRGIDLTKEKDAIEIWMIIDNEAYVYYFFPYDNGVIWDF